MKVIMKYDEYSHPPVLSMAIHGAPHKRMHRAVLQQYREDLFEMAQRRIADQVDLPIDHAIDLKVLFTNPSSPDLDHLMEALYMALDGKSLKGPSILKDDRHIWKFECSKFYPEGRTKRDSSPQ